MATYVPGNNQPVSFPENPAPPRGPQDATCAPSYGVSGLSSDLEVRAHQLSLLVEVNAALAGALDVENALGPILSRLADPCEILRRSSLRFSIPIREASPSCSEAIET